MIMTLVHVHANRMTASWPHLFPITSCSCSQCTAAACKGIVEQLKSGRCAVQVTTVQQRRTVYAPNGQQVPAALLDPPAGRLAGTRSSTLELELQAVGSIA